MPSKFPRPAVVPETLDARFDRYCFYFTLTPEQLARMHRSFVQELDAGLSMHRDSPNRWLPDRCSLMCLDTCVNVLPTGKEQGVFYAVDFGGTNVRAVRIELHGGGEAVKRQVKTNIRNVERAKHLPKGLLDKHATATMLFDAIAMEVKQLMEKEGDLGLEALDLGFTFSFAIDQKRLDRAIATGWTKGFETGTATKDPVIGRDVCTLLDVACERNGVPAKVAAALNDTTGTLLSAAYEKPRNLPPCMIGVILGTGVNGCYYQPGAEEWGYQGCLLNTELGGYNKDLPWNVIDIEVDFASTNRGRQALEKMMAGMYIAELCRRVVIKVFQSEAPKRAWTHETMPGECCAAIMNDETPDLAETREILHDLWDWTPPKDYVQKVQQLFTKVFDRSAALASVVIAGMARQTGRLQPALGGVTVGVDGSLYTRNEKYRKMLVHHFNALLGEDTASLIHFLIADDGSGKGAAILAACVDFQRQRSTVSERGGGGGRRP